MAAQKGRSILLKLSDGTSPGAFTTIGGIRSKTVTINNETVDITTDTSAPWRALLGDAGLRTVSVSGSGVFENDATIILVENLALLGTLEEFQMVFPNGVTLQGVFQVASFEHGGEHTAEQTYSITLESAGIVAKV